MEDAEGEKIHIMPYRPPHLGETIEMYQDFPTEHRSHGLPPIMEDKLEAWVRTLEENGRAFVAQHGDEVVGHAAYTPITAKRPDFVVFIAPDYHDRGIGTALLYHVVQNTAIEGFEGVESYVDSDNERAIHVYEKCGFKEVDREPMIVKMKFDHSESTSNANEYFRERT